MDFFGDGILFGDGRPGNGYGLGCLPCGVCRDHLFSHVGSVTVGKLVDKIQFCSMCYYTVITNKYLK